MAVDPVQRDRRGWRLYKRHWFVWSLATLIVAVGYSIVTGAVYRVLVSEASAGASRRFPLPHCRLTGGPLILVSTWSAAFSWAE